MMKNNLTDTQIKKLIEDKKDPIKSFIERNKLLASKEYIGLSDDIDWVIPKEAVYELVKLIKQLNEII